MCTPIGVVIPAHNESALLARGLEVLHAEAPPQDVVVVRSECPDNTAKVARATDLPVPVIEILEPSKAGAVRLGSRPAPAFLASSPRRLTSTVTR